MGSSVAPYICQKVMEPILLVLKQQMNDQVQAYVYLDDIIILGTKKQVVAVAGKKLMKLLTRLNMSINMEKSTPEPTTDIDWLGNRVIMHPGRPHDIAVQCTEEKKCNLKYLATKLNPAKRRKRRCTIGNVISFAGVAGFMAQVCRGAR